MQDSLRLFVAVPLPEEVKQYLVNSRAVYEDPSIRMVPDKNLHLTLFFIGNVPLALQPVILGNLNQIAQAHLSFTLALDQLEPGPKRTAPRLIWARFQEHAAFNRLSQDLTKALAVHPPKQEKFIPHVTLCRFKKDPRPSKNLPIVFPEEEVLFPVQRIALWQSTLGSPHPVYHIVQEFPLGQPLK